MKTTAKDTSAFKSNFLNTRQYFSELGSIKVACCVLAAMTWLFGYCYKETPRWIPLEVAVTTGGGDLVQEAVKFSLAGMHPLLLRVPTSRVNKNTSGRSVPVQIYYRLGGDDPHRVSDLLSYGTVRDDQLYLIGMVKVAAPGTQRLEISGIKTIPDSICPATLEVRLSEDLLKRRLVIFQICTWVSYSLAALGLFMFVCRSRKPSC